MDTSNSSIPVRRCKTCNKEYPLTSVHWHKDKTDKYGYTYSCKECARARSRKHHWDNREEILEGHRTYYAENRLKFQEYRRDNAEYIAEKKQEWRKANPDKVKKHKSDSQKRHRASANKRSKRYNLLHPDKIRERTRIGQHRRRHAEGKFTRADIELQIKAQTDRKGVFRCWWCCEPIVENYHIDHRIPVTRDGSNNPGNLVLAHPKCNQSKSDKLPHEWSDRLL